MKACKIPGCDDPRDARGWCKAHYERWRRNGDPLLLKRPARDPICTVPGCEDDHYAKGYCQLHYHQWYAYGDPEYSPQIQRELTCSIQGCDEPHHARGWCEPHYRRWLSRGVVWDYWQVLEINETKREASRLAYAAR